MRCDGARKRKAAVLRTALELGEMETPGPWVDSPRRSEWEAQSLENVVRRRPNGVIRSPVEILLCVLFTFLPELSNSPLPLRAREGSY